MSLAPDLDMITNMTIMHTTVILILFLPVTAAVKTLHNSDMGEFSSQNEPLQLYEDGPGLWNLPFSCDPASTQIN